MEHPFHPAANRYPLMAREQLDELAASLKAHGYQPQIRKIITLDGLILDGRNFYLACRAAGISPIPFQEEYAGDRSDEGIAAFVEAANEHRRHLTPEQQQHCRAARLERVAALRREGHSLPAIAAVEGVSVAQVRRDLDDAGRTLPGGKVTPDGGVVTGRDGRQQPARRTSVPEPPAPEHDDVQRHPDDDPPPPQPAPKKNGTPVDGEGNPLPARLRDVFADGWLASVAAELKAWHEALDFAPVRSGVRKRYDHLPWLRLQDFLQQLDAAEDALALAIETARQALPYAVCPDCVGDGCEHCLHSGYLPQWKWEETRS